MSRNLRLYAFSIWMLLALEAARIVRTFVGTDPVYVAIAAGRLFDLAFILIWLGQLSRRMTSSRSAVILIGLCLYPAVLALPQDPHVRTFVNDLILYLGFLAKVEVLRDALRSASAWEEVAHFVRRYAVVVTLATTGVVLFVYLANLTAVGVFQVQIDITPAGAYAAAAGHVGWLVALALVSAAAGKRMYLAGVLFLLLVTLMRGGRSWARSAVLVVVLLIGVFALRDFAGRAGQLDGVRRSVETVQSVTQSDVVGLLPLLELVDPIRVAEARSVVSELDERDAWVFGAGYGVRYEIRHPFVDAEVDSGQLDRTHTNSHFTPLGVVLKFGLVGLLGWTLVLSAGVLSLAKPRRMTTGTEVFVRRFALLGIVVYGLESLLAYVFFTAPFVPLLVAIALRPRPIADDVSEQTLHEFSGVGA